MSRFNGILRLHEARKVEAEAYFAVLLREVVAEADETLLEVLRLGLSNLPDVEVDAPHREHMAGELVFLFS